MSRPLRIQFPGAWYHVMNRGANKQITFQDDNDRKDFLGLLKAIHYRYKIEVHAYCLMNNHYHLMLRINSANLSQAMRHLNGVYTQRYNCRHNIDGPLFRGRYKSILVDAENYLLRLSRYIHLNPVSA
jgi:putative transposase